MRRGNKPQQQIYRPGSGPLRKSVHGIEESESDTNIVINSRQNLSKNPVTRLRSEGSSPRNNDIVETTSKLGDMTIKGNDPKRKTKKPEQALYVPPVLAQVKESIESVSQMKNNGDRQERSSNIYMNGNNYQDSSRSKRFSNRRRPSEGADLNKSWKQMPPNSNHLRQGSEPRVVSNGSNWNRMRDTKSVEPVVMATRNYNEKIFSKPPSGRRHSTIGLEEKRPKIPNLDTLPPRLRKKFLEDNKLNYHNQPIIEDSWDGSSVTFQGSHIHQQSPHNYLPKQNYPPQMNTPYQNPHLQHNVYYTLPNKHRGRGRMQQEYNNMSGSYRSVTPDKMYLISPSNSRPSTPTIFGSKARSNENINRTEYQSYINKNNDNQQCDPNMESEERFNDHTAENRNKTETNKSEADKTETTESAYRTPGNFRRSLEDQLSPVSPASITEKETLVSSSSGILVSI